MYALFISLGSSIWEVWLILGDKSEQVFASAASILTIMVAPHFTCTHISWSFLILKLLFCYSAILLELLTGFCWCCNLKFQLVFVCPPLSSPLKRMSVVAAELDLKQHLQVSTFAWPAIYYLLVEILLSDNIRVNFTAFCENYCSNLGVIFK